MFRTAAAFAVLVACSDDPMHALPDAPPPVDAPEAPETEPITRA